MRKLIARLTALDGDKWHALTMKMGWVYRTGGMHPVPPIIMAGLNGKTPDRETWDLLRLRVNAARKASKASERRYIEQTRRNNRRAYMAKYMRTRRQKERQASA